MSSFSNYAGGMSLPPDASKGLSFAWAFSLISSLYNEGIREVLISPGSRSTPLVLALEAHGGFRTRVVLDERSAGFAALGIGKHARYPAALICTSGTAALNFAPAIQEACSSGTPLVVITADRPPSLRGTGSSQTIDQLKIYGDRVVFFHECGLPSIDSKAFRRIQLVGKQAVQEALLQRGVSHVNVAFDKPFEPTENQWKEAQQSASRQIKKSVNFTPLIEYPKPSGLGDILQGAKRPLILAGPMNFSDPLFHVGDALVRAVHAENQNKGSISQIPVLSDPGSCFGSEASGDVAQVIVQQFEGDEKLFSAFTPDLIIQLGDTPYSAPLTSLLEKWQDVQHLLITSRFTWQDPFSLDPMRWVTQSASDVIDALRAGFTNQEPDWTNMWTTARDGISKQIKSIPLDSDSMTDLAAIEAFCTWLPDHTPIFLSNSMIPRDVGLIQSRLGSHLFYVNRGAAGIDGITSSAVGVQFAQNKSTALLTGDLAFLHDAGALALSRQLTAPLLVCVIQNGGGTIFRKLPIFNTIERERFVNFFETPQHVDLDALCRAYQIPYQKMTSYRDLHETDHPAQPGIYVYEWITDADASHLQRKEFAEAVCAVNWKELFAQHIDKITVTSIRM